MLKYVMNKLKIKQAFTTVFSLNGLINKAYYFALVPFFSSIILAAIGFNLKPNLIVIFAGIFLGIIAVLYQLYLWATAFFYAQQISENNWDDYGLSLQELITDFDVKLRIIVIRFVWYMPILAAGLVLVVVNSNKITGIISNFSNLTIDNPDLTIITIGILLFLFLQLLLENTLINISLFIYSQTGSIRKSLNFRKVFKLLKSVFLNYIVIMFLSIIPAIIVSVFSIPIILITSIPVIGGLVWGLILGLEAMYSTLFISNLQGQIWNYLREKYNQ